MSKFFESPHGRKIAALSVMMAATLFSCEITPSLDPEESAPVTEVNATSLRVSGTSTFELLYVNLAVQAIVHPHQRDTMIVQIRDGSGQTILGESSVLVDPARGHSAFFPARVMLTKGETYRIYVALKRASIAPVMWVTNSGTPNQTDAYPQGNSSGSGDFNFSTVEVVGDYDQVSYANGSGIALQVNQFQWQEFVPGDQRVGISNVNLWLSHSLPYPEDMFVEIRTVTGQLVATSNYVSTSMIGVNAVRFKFATPAMLDRNTTYRIYALRTGWPIFYYEAVQWLYGPGNSYAGGVSSMGARGDFAFQTDINGKAIDQSQTITSGSYPPMLTSYELSTQWQEFTPKLY